MTKQDFIKKIGILANQNMRKTKILASLTIAQAILESNWGQSGLTLRANNLFGIKGEYNGQYEIAKTSEYYNGEWVTVDAKFRKYPSWTESIQDHSELLQKPRYQNLIGVTDYTLACKLIREDGYATDPEYTNKLISIIEYYGLTKYDISLEDAKKIVKSKYDFEEITMNFLNSYIYREELFISMALAVN